MINRILLVTVLTSSAVLIEGQPAGPPAFEVASVRQHPIPVGMMRRPWSPNIDCGPIAQCGLSGNRFNEVASLVDLVMDAYKVKRFQISGLPSWGDSGRDIYDVTATMPEGGTAMLDQARLDQARRMLQTLLADRFQLKIHHETRELPVYALVIGKNGPKLKPTTVACGLPEVAGGAPPPPPPPGGGRGGAKGGDGGAKGGGGGARGGGVLTLLNSWALMPEMLSMFADRPVVDKTGLQEPAYCTLDGLDPLFSVVMLVGPGAGGGRGDTQARTAIPDADSTGASIFTAVEEKWGMKLEPQKAPVDLLVIDRVERPSEN
jgi:uncharacterized protein (TIGR03435 family)